MKKISRRSFLLAAGVCAAAGVLTACGGSSNDNDTAAKITSIDQLYEGKKIGVQLGTTGDIYATDDFGAENVEQYNKGADAVQALKTGKVDAVIIDNEPAKSFVAVNDDLTILEAPYTEEDYAICLAKDSALTAQFNTAIAEIKAEGILDAILDKYINGVEGAAGYVTPEGTKYPNGKLVMATNAYFPPYEYYEGETIVGIDAEFAKAICDKLGYELEISDIEFDAIIPAVNSGKADFGAAGMTVTPERLENVDFTDSYATGVQAVIVRK